MKSNIKKLIFSSFTALGLILIAAQVNAADFPKKGDFVQGAKAWANNCTRCHTLRDATELSDDQWITTMFHMRVRAGLTGEETRDILTFLQQSN